VNEYKGGSQKRSRGERVASVSACRSAESGHLRITYVVTRTEEIVEDYSIVNCAQERLKELTEKM
jgi:hypothetical protein